MVAHGVWDTGERFESGTFDKRKSSLKKKVINYFCIKKNINIIVTQCIARSSNG